MASLVELLWVLLIGVCVFYATKLDSRKWLLVDAGLAFVFGACTIPFACESQRMQTSGFTVDQDHGYLCNLYICYCLMTAIATILLRYSTDPTTVTALLISRTVGASLATLFITYGHFYTSIFNLKHLLYGVLGNAAWAAVNAYHLFKEGNANKRGVAAKVDLFLKVDIGFALCYALPDVLAPSFILNTLAGMKADELHLHLLQVGGAIHIGTAALSYMALRFSSTEHKKAVLVSRMSIMVLMFAIRTFSWIWLETSTPFFAYFLACTGFLPFFPAYVGFRTAD